MFNSKNPQEEAYDLQKIPAKDNYKIIMLDIKDLYVNLLTQNIVNITKFWLKVRKFLNLILKHFGFLKYLLILLGKWLKIFTPE